MRQGRRGTKGEFPIRVEWPTVGVAIAVYGGWLALTAWHAALPWPVLALAGGWLIAWHGSLQHEVIHGHPTGRRGIDDAIGSVPLSLWLPYAVYRRSHLLHHGTAAITDPFDDPESRYIARPSRWQRIRATVQATLLGHLLIGPAIVIGRFLASEAQRLRRAPRQVLRDWTPHLIATALVLLWLRRMDLGIDTYLACFVYPGTALSLLRSYAEHRAELATPGRAATVESRGALSLLFLHNNLHVAHHERPRLPWYRLPAYHRANRARFSAAGTRRYAGYREVLRRYLLAPHDAAVHPHYQEVQP
ncbi:hypothetical protein GCM10011380_05940 [Sphingomonas metalli]|uniref:Fatty acid desaturase domain-containing protein n=1 Tax=Sphingomonas metalli TaxID=1779358 RepID=A0A916WQ61_9SPHN|nr:fatty acid desaturase [Sphingomonas metalli]GGB19170.1 hypothetical protein GCM10011380_05940 [Sphingomonas metalli]